jgi:DNA-binding NarL/FixJ family response regulator
MQQPHKYRIIIVDDHPIVRRGLGGLINQESDMCVCGEADSVGTALTVIQRTPCDIAVVDINLRDSDGLDLIKKLKRHYPNVVVLVISMYEELIYAERAVRAGAKGYVMKAELDDTIINALRKVIGGGVYLSEAVRDRIIQSIQGQAPGDFALLVEKLSDKELEVFRMMGRGLKTKDIADKMHISAKTVETYKGRIKDKLNLPSVSDLYQYSIQWTSHQQA